MMNQYKQELVDTLYMLSDIDRQNQYYAESKVADIPSDLICGWFDTGFFIDDKHFKSLFTTDEWNALLAFNNYFESKVDKLPEEFLELINDPNWLNIVNEAKETIRVLDW